MHKLGTRLLTFDDFSIDSENGNNEITPLRQMILDDINFRIEEFQKLKKEGKHDDAMKLWRTIVFDLPQSYNFRATWTGSYQNMRNIYLARRNHKQREFRDFAKYIEENFPCVEFITTSNN